MSCLPAELWILILALASESAAIPETTRFFSSLLNPIPRLVDQAWRTRIARHLLESVTVTAKGGSRLLKELTPHEQLFPGSNFSHGHPLRALLYVTSSPRNQQHALTHLVYHQILIHPATLKGLLNRPRIRHDPHWVSNQFATLPEQLEQNLCQKTYLLPRPLLNPLVLAPFYASHFAYTGDTRRLALVLDLLDSSLADTLQEAWPTEPCQAASPLLWSLAVADSLAIRSVVRKYCQLAHIGVVRGMEAILGIGDCDDTDLPFRMTFPVYLVWLALFYWRLDVAQFLVDRFKMDIKAVMAQFSLPELANSILCMLPRLGVDQEDMDLEARVMRQLEWMVSHGWALKRIVRCPTSMRATVAVICQHLPVSKANYPLFVKVFRMFDEQDIAAQASVPGITFDDEFCARVAAFVDWDSSFVDLVPFFVEHVGKVKSHGELVILLRTLLRANQFELARALSDRCASQGPTTLNG